MSAAERQFDFVHRDRAFQIGLTEDGTLELRLDGLVRKARPAQTAEPQYVWTNVELQWEEHHYIEARYWASTGELSITVNREPLHQVQL
ncbi:MAG: hypothetical protein AAF648_03590 [Pseudomonadota bacterium]